VRYGVHTCVEGDKAAVDVRQLRVAQRVVPPGKAVAEQELNPLQRWRLAHHICQAQRSTHEGGGLGLFGGQTYRSWMRGAACGWASEA
jgi:hypothetical protein